MDSIMTFRLIPRKKLEKMLSPYALYLLDTMPWQVFQTNHKDVLAIKVDSFLITTCKADRLETTILTLLE